MCRVRRDHTIVLAQNIFFDRNSFPECRGAPEYFVAKVGDDDIISPLLKVQIVGAPGVVQLEINERKIFAIEIGMHRMQLILCLRLRSLAA